MVDNDQFSWNFIGLDDAGGYFSFRPSSVNGSAIEAPIHDYSDPELFEESAEDEVIHQDAEIEEMNEIMEGVLDEQELDDQRQHNEL